MPTPSGMPKVGESVWLRETDDTWLEGIVTRREGRAADYSLWVQRADGGAWRGKAVSQDRIVTECPWWITHGSIRLSPPAERVGGDGSTIRLERTVTGTHR